MTGTRTAPGQRRPVRLLVAALLALAGAVAVAAAVTAYAAPWRTATGTTRCAAPALAGTAVRVTATDMAGMSGGMMGGGARTMMLRADRASVPAGTVSLQVANLGTRTHELVVLPLPANQATGARTVARDDTVSETGSLGEASRSCGAGHGDGITAGATGWVTLHLTPGRYELVCNLPGHYRHGMYTELDVT